MKNIIIALIMTALMSTQAASHSGRTDSNGGHKCSQKSKNKGLCTGYHKHKKKPRHSVKPPQKPITKTDKKPANT